MADVGGDDDFADPGLPQPEQHRAKVEPASRLGEAIRQHGSPARKSGQAPQIAADWNPAMQEKNPNTAVNRQKS